MSKSIPLRAHEAAAYAAGRLTQLRRVCKFDPKIVHASYPDGTFETARIFSDRDNPRTPWESNTWCWVIDVEGVEA